MPSSVEARRRARRRCGGPPPGSGAAGASSGVRRLVLPQGQARPRRARHRGGGPRGRGGDRASGCGSGVPLARQSYPNGRPDQGRRLLGRPGGRRPRRVAATWSTTRSTRSPGSRSTRRPKRLTYDRDRATLGEAVARRQEDTGAGRCCGTARPARGSRGGKRRPDPTAAGGRRRAGRRGRAHARGVRRHPHRHVVEHPLCSTPCAPYAEHTGWPLTRTDDLSEEDATAAVGARGSSTSCSHADEDAVLCTHRPGAAVGLRRHRHPARAPGARASSW